jgi:YtkA-like
MIGSVEEQPVVGQALRKGQRWQRWAVVALVALLAGGFGMMRMHMSAVPANLDLATTQISNAGIYRVRYESAAAAIPINQIHAWTIYIETANGRPIEGATITVDGDMPQHLHGLPTAPKVTQDLGGGAYLVEGLKFHMPGWWVVDYTISAAGQIDTVRFNLQLR